MISVSVLLLSLFVRWQLISFSFVNHWFVGNFFFIFSNFLPENFSVSFFNTHNHFYQPNKMFNSKFSLRIYDIDSNFWCEKQYNHISYGNMQKKNAQQNLKSRYSSFNVLSVIVVFIKLMITMMMLFLCYY